MPLITINCLTAHIYIYIYIYECVCLFNYINTLYDSSNVHYINVTLLLSYTQQNILLTRIFSFLSDWLTEQSDSWLADYTRRVRTQMRFTRRATRTDEGLLTRPERSGAAPVHSGKGGLGRGSGCLSLVSLHGLEWVLWGKPDVKEYKHSSL